MKRRKQSRPTPAFATKSNQERGLPRHFWQLLGLLLLLSTLGAGAVFTWRRQTHAAQLRASLPTRPDLVGKPSMLVAALDKAEIRAKSPDGILEGIVTLGQLYHANGFYREAEACWKFMRTAQPREARWCYYLADLHRAASDYPEMSAQLDDTLKLAPDYSPALLQLANLQFKTGDLDHAAINYRLRLAQLPHDPYAQLGLARFELHKGRRGQAKILLEAILRDAPNFGTAHNLYAELLAATGDIPGANKHRWLGVETLRYRDAEDPWLEELQSFCFDYDRLCVLGTIELQTEHSDRAKAFFERAIALNPGEHDAYEMLGVLYLKQNDAAKAREVFEQALPHLTASKAPLIFINLSRAYRLLKQPVEALRVARRGLELAGETTELLNAAGLALADDGQHEKAVETFHAALALSPNDAETNYNLAVSELARSRLDEALAALDHSLILQPTYPPTLLLRGEIEMEAGHWDQVEKYLLPVFESHPENVQARQLLAEWHRRMGSMAETENSPAGAEQHYRDGLTIDSSNTELQANLGVFYLVHTRFSEAIGPLESYHNSQPENIQGYLFLGQAYAGAGLKGNARKILTEGIQLAERTGNAKAVDFGRELLQKL